MTRKEKDKERDAENQANMKDTFRLERTASQRGKGKKFTLWNIFTLNVTDVSPSPQRRYQKGSRTEQDRHQEREQDATYNEHNGCRGIESRSNDATQSNSPSQGQSSHIDLHSSRLRPDTDLLGIVEYRAAQLLEHYQLKPKPDNSNITSLLDGIPDYIRWFQTQLETKSNEVKQARRDASVWYAQFMESQAEERTTKSQIWQQNQKIADLEGSLELKDSEYKATIHALEQSQAEERKRIHQEHTKMTEDMRLDHERNISGLTEKHSREISSLKQTHKGVVSQIKQRHEAEVSELTESHSAQLSTAREEAQQHLDMVTLQKNEEIASKASQIERLLLRLASFSTENFTPIPDQKFSASLSDLSQKIINLCSQIPRQDGSTVDSTLDPHGFLVRQGTKARNWPKFVRNICWKLLLDGFFHCPLGFGAFGSEGEGHEILLREYNLFQRVTHSGEPDTRSHLPTDRNANVARAWRFDAILKSVTSPEARSGSHIRWADMFERNIEAVAKEMGRVLRLLGGNSHGSHKELITLARETGMLALQIGSQRAHVLVETCEFGQDARELGVRFRCDGDASWSVKVELMLQPCLRRLGDGGEDLRTEKVLVPGEFLPQK